MNPRLYFDIPITWEVLPAQTINMPDELSRVFQRVHPAEEGAGKKIDGRLRDLSSTGAFITGTPPPLLARIGLVFGIPGYSKVEAIGWVLWRRTEDVVVEDKPLEAGFGILFEYLQPEARLHIDRLVRMQTSSQNLDNLWGILLD